MQITKAAGINPAGAPDEAQLQKINKPCKYLPSGGAGTLGYEIPAAFGVKVAKPEHQAVTVVGDFGLTFMGEEIAVATAFKKPIIVVVVNNAYLGLIRQNQKGYGFEYAVEMPYNQDGTIDYVKLGEAYGCVAERVFSPEELKAALVRAKASTCRRSARQASTVSCCQGALLSPWQGKSKAKAPSPSFSR